MSHAGFFSGDVEEQEYWIQKNGYESDFDMEIDGPIVLLGVYWNPPYIHRFLNESFFEPLSSLLPTYWTICVLDNKELDPSEDKVYVEISYDHPKFLQFKDIHDSLSHDIESKYGFGE